MGLLGFFFVLPLLYEPGDNILGIPGDSLKNHFQEPPDLRHSSQYILFFHCRCTAFRKARASIDKLEDMPRQARLDDRQGPVVKGRKILCQMGWRCESWDT